MIANTDIEGALIGEILCRPDIFADCVQELKPEDFTVFEYKYIYSICLKLFGESKKIDPLVILSEVNPVDRTEYKVLMANTVNLFISIANYKEHIRIIRDAARLNRATRAAQEFVEMVEATQNVSACRNSAAEILKMFDGLDGEKTVSAAEGYKLFLEEAGKKHEYIETGIAEIDHHVKISLGDFIVIGGRPSAGKTALTLQVMLKMAETRRTVYFSLETAADKLFNRMIANYARFKFKKIKQGNLNQNEIDYIKEVCDGRFPELNFWVVNAAGWTVEQIKSKAMQMQAEVIFIDYLGLISSQGKSQYEKTTQISQELHISAQSLKTTVISLVQLNREGKKDPDMTSLRDSGQIEQDADIILLLSSPNESDESVRDLTIAKNKDGETGKVKLNFNGDYQKFTAIEGRR